jgi:8-oxo-dGTP pyrophosphatase MutT (NUDIX family)
MRASKQCLAALRQRLPGNSAKPFNGDPEQLLEPGADAFRQAAVMVAIAEQQGQDSVLWTRRAAHLNLHPGEAAFPGGKRDPQDASLLATALREADEEVGLQASQFEYLGMLDQHLTRSNITVAPFVGLALPPLRLRANLSELDCIYAVPLDFFAERNNMQLHSVQYHGLRRDVPRFQYRDARHGEQLIWGVTALIIVDLMNTVFDAGLHVPPFEHPHYG